MRAGATHGKAKEIQVSDEDWTSEREILRQLADGKEHTDKEIIKNSDGKLSVHSSSFWLTILVNRKVITSRWFCSCGNVHYRLVPAVPAFKITERSK